MTIQARFHEKRIHFTFDIEMTIPMNGITAVYGPSGSGKTTLLRAIAGLDKFANGYLQVGDSIWQNRSSFKKTHHRPIGYVFQEPSLFSHLTVEKNLEYGLNRLPEQRQRFAMDHAIELFDIGNLLNHFPAQLSGGESQRVAIARALAVNPQLLLMDEPLCSLDSKRKSEILPYLESLHNDLKIPVIYVSHATEEVIRLADHLVMMEKGKITTSGKINEMLTHLKSPFLNNNDATSLIFAKVTGHDETYGLTFADFPGGRFHIAQKDLEPGQTIRLQVRARDVSLTLQPAKETSILNIFPATIEKLHNDGDSHIIITVNAGGCPILCRITRKSAFLLNLQPGTSVYAQIKSAALLN